MHMQATEDTSDLSGRLLIAMPGMGDPRFAHSVVFVCAHTRRGAMGLIVNKPAAELSFPELLEQLAIPDRSGDCPIHLGGPVEPARGFVLHSPYSESAGEATIDVGIGFRMTTTPDILRRIAEGSGPARALLALGYAGWDAGQLEREIAENAWLISDAAPELVFSGDNGTKWHRALMALGIDPLSLSATAGRA